MDVAVITGAGSGIGLATALRFRDMGYAVLGVGRDKDKLVELEKQFDNKDQVATLSADVTADETPDQVVDLAVKRWGQINYLVNNAGVGRPTPVDETDDERLDLFLNLMLRAPFRQIRQALPHMPYGSSIVNVTSTFAIIGGLRGGPYSAAKGGLHGLTLHLAAEYGPRGIRSNCVAPGVTPTPMTEGRYENEIFWKMNKEMTPYPRYGTVDDVVNMIAFLCTPASEFVNGQMIAVDGGWSSTKYMSEFGRMSEWKARD
jgi:NAD(P)-dependent dehydrogenase (short-subunit alcohol dehydrogenase family)